MRLLGGAGREHALSHHLAAPRALGELTDPDLGSTPPRRRYAVRAAGCCGAVGADPADAAPVAAADRRRGRVDALRVEYRRVLLRLAARDLGPPRWASTTSRPSWPTSPPAPSRRPWPWPGPRVGRGRRRATRLAVIAMGKCGGRELNYVSDVDVIFVSEPAEGGRRGSAALRVATQLARPPDAGLLRPHRRGHDLAGRRRRCAPRARPGRSCGPSPATAATTSAGPRPGSSRRCSRPAPVAGDLELGPRLRRDDRRPDGLAGRRARGLRRGRPGDAAPGRSSTCPPTRPSASSSSAPAGCATSSSPSSCSSSCTAAPTSGSAPAPTLSALGRPHPRRLRRPRGRRGAARGLRLPAHPRAPDPAAPAAPHPRRARRRGRPAPPRAGPWASSSTRSSELDKAWQPPPPRGPAAAREALLPPAARPRSRGSAATRPGCRPRRPGSAWPRSGYADPPGALRHLEALTAGRQPAGRHPAHAAAGDARVVRRRARPRRRAVRLPADQRGARRHATGTSRLLRDEGGSPSGWPGCWPPRRYATDLLEREPQGVRDARRGPRHPLTARGADRPRCSRDRAGARPTADAAVRAVRAIRRRELLRIAVGDLLRRDRRRRGRGRRCPGLTDATLEAALEAPRETVRASARARPTAPSRSRSWRWAATAASSCATAATPT